MLFPRHHCRVQVMSPHGLCILMGKQRPIETRIGGAGAPPRETALAGASGTLGGCSRDFSLQEGRTALAASNPGLRTFLVYQAEFSRNTIRIAVQARVSTSERSGAQPFTCGGLGRLNRSQALM